MSGRPFSTTRRRARAFAFLDRTGARNIEKDIYIYTYIHVCVYIRTEGRERRRTIETREIVISVSPDCGPLTSQRLEPRVTVLIIMRVFAARLGCARVRVGALTVRLNAINAPPLDSRSARSLAYRGQRSSNRINRFVVPRSAKRSTAPGVGRYLESSSTLLFNLSTPSRRIEGWDGEGTRRFSRI